MAFGFEQQPVVGSVVPYVQTDNARFNEITSYPKWKYHKKYPQGLVIDNIEEEVALGEGWVDSPAEFGVETHPAVNKEDAAAVKLAQIRAALKAKE